MEYHIILYTRISVEDSDVGIDEKCESDSVKNQRGYLYSFVNSKPEFKDSDITELCDDGYTGTNFDRPAVRELLRRAGEKTVDCIIVKDFSRFGRDYLIVSDYVDQIFPLLGIRFISVNDGYDSAALNGTTSGLDMAFRNVVYAYYSRDISEKVRSGKRTKAQRGDYLSSFAPIGYQKDKDNKNHLVIDKISAEIVRRIFHMSGSGMRVADISRLLNAEQIPTPRMLKKKQGYHHKWWDGLKGDDFWDTSVITRILRDERYLGYSVYGRKRREELGSYRVKRTSREDWIVVPDCHEPIVTREEFQAAQQTLRTYREVKKRKQSGHLFIGKIRCGVCGYALICEGKVNPRYRCMTAALRTSECDCAGSRILEEELVDVVWQSVQLYCKTFLEKKKRVDNVSDKNGIAAMQKQILIYQVSDKNLEEQKAILYERMIDKEFSREQYVSKRNFLSEKQKELHKKIYELKIKIKDLEERDNEREPSAQVIKDELQADCLTHEMVLALLDCIYVYGNKVIHIDWLFDFKSLLDTTRRRGNSDG